MKSGAGLPVFRRSATTGIANRKIAKSTSPDRQVFVTGAAGPLIRVCLHAIACIASLTVGYRFSREALLILVQPDVPVFRVPTRIDASAATMTEAADLSLRFPYEPSGGVSGVTDPSAALSKSSRVHVGRHEILVRPWPHPDSVELYRAHALVDIVQREQRSIYGPKGWRPVIAITTTFARTFQRIHLGGILHTVRGIPGSVIWIVVEAGGKSNDTASILASAAEVTTGTVHLTINEPMPTDWDQRRLMETRLRIEGLRYVRREKLDGVIVFADDGNVHSLELFDEMQKVNWIGALSVGLLKTRGPLQPVAKELPVQGPACNESCHIIGWHAPRASPVDADSSFVGVTDVARHLEWSGFVINSRAVWEAGQGDKPEWIRDWDEWITGGDTGSPLRLAKDQVYIEALGNCGRDVLLWWLRVEARSDSRYPSRWELQSPLEVVVASKRTPWPEFVPSKHHQKNQQQQMQQMQQMQQQQQHGDSSSSSARQKRKRRQHQQQQQQQQGGVLHKLDVS